ncbi:MAG TPA: FkbM family methyltransferase [Gaiellaceae bacterium]|nr:FkbM family methyltransferase [Gaiellaceae bacterium]
MSPQHRTDRVSGAVDALLRLIEELPVDTAGELMEKLPPVHELDYEPHRIRLAVSSTEIAVRLRSVEKEPFTVEWIEREIRPGDVFYDIGANVGAYSLIAAKATGNGAQVFAFEPSAASFHDLSQNVLLNGCAESIAPLPFALWSENGPLSLRGSSAVAGAARHRIAAGHGLGEPGSLTILAVTLDELIERFGLPVPTHAKIDTDGYELDVLRGAERTLARPEWRSIIVELDPGDTKRNREIQRRLRDAGFDGGLRHTRLASPNFPRPEGRPDVYWTFDRVQVSTARVQRLPVWRAGAIAAALAVLTLLLLVLAGLPDGLADRLGH